MIQAIRGTYPVGSHKDTTRRSRNQICRIGSGEGIPLLGQEGWTRPQDAAKPPLKARPGWSVRRKRRRAGLTTPSAPLRLLRVFFLMPQPPLLSQEGNTLACRTSLALDSFFWRRSFEGCINTPIAGGAAYELDALVAHGRGALPDRRQPFRRPGLARKESARRKS